VYAIVGSVAYLVYGGGVQVNLLDNVSFDAAGHPLLGLQWLQKLAAAMFAAKLQVVQPLLIEPLACMLEACMFQISEACGASKDNLELGEPQTEPNSGIAHERDTDDATTFADRLYHFAVRCVCAVVALALAVLCKDSVVAVTELAGSVACLSMVLTFPILFYLKLFGDSLPLSMQALLVAVGLFSLTLQVFGAWQAMQGFLGPRAR